jgi:hypothetical protein
MFLSNVRVSRQEISDIMFSERFVKLDFNADREVIQLCLVVSRYNITNLIFRGAYLLQKWGNDKAI